MKMAVQGKFVLILFFFFFSVVGVFAQTYKPVWSDEFDGASIDQSKWVFETGGGGWGNKELEYYTSRPSNVYLDNGNLVIKAVKESYNGSSYTSARMKTQGKFSFKYGKAEARIKLPYGKGIWPAFWMLGDNISTIGWPKCGELDIMEMVGGGTAGDRTAYGTAHWDDNGHKSYGLNYALSSGKFSDGFHTFAVTWDAQKIAWFVDDKQYCVIDITPAALSAFQNNFFLILNLAVGGEWPGSPDATTTFPQTMIVDYVRVYKLADLVPDVTVTSPENFSTFDANSTIKLKTDAKVGSGAITLVEFYQDAMKIGETDLAPYEMTWRNVSAGNYKIKAKAYSSQGYTAVSDVVTVVVGSNAVTVPYGGTPAQVPGIIEAENFDMGGNNKSYYDSDAVNNGGTYRNESVDIETCTDTGGGFDVGWTNDNEWLLYTINVSKTGTFQFSPRVSSTSDAGKFHIEIDGIDVTGIMSVPNTGASQTWNSIASKSVSLQAGVHQMKVIINTGGFNLNKIEIYPPDAAPQLNLITPNGGEIYQAGSIQEILWAGTKVSTVRIGYSTDGGVNWSIIVSAANSAFGVYRWKLPDIDADSCKILILSKDNFAIQDTTDGVFKIQKTLAVKTDNNTTPKGFVLEQNFPNPFNPATFIKFGLPETSFVVLKIYDVLGREVKTLLKENIQAGLHQVRWLGDNETGLPVTSGTYLYKLTTDKYSQSKKMILQR